MLYKQALSPIINWGAGFIIIIIKTAIKTFFPEIMSAALFGGNSSTNEDSSSAAATGTRVRTRQVHDIQRVSESFNRFTIAVAKLAVGLFVANFFIYAVMNFFEGGGRNSRQFYKDADLYHDCLEKNLSEDIHVECRAARERLAAPRSWLRSAWDEMINETYLCGRSSCFGFLHGLSEVSMTNLAYIFTILVAGVMTIIVVARITIRWVDWLDQRGYLGGAEAEKEKVN